MRDPVLFLILACALCLRLYLAATAGYVHDEENTSIPLASTISFSPGHVHLPLRGENHGALPAYVVKASSLIFGTTALGYRAMHVLLGLATIVLVYLLASQWYGAVAARWAAALLAFNEYYLGVSARATAHVPHLFFVTAAAFAFSRFLQAQRPVYLYAAGALVGLAFYCKEHSALLLPVFFITLLQAPYRRWLRSAHVYLACLTFALVIGPDLLWNLRADPETARVSYGDQTMGQATYSNHLRRVGGLGLSPYPLMFYGRGPVQSIYLRATGRELKDETPEYPSLYPVLGALLFASILLTTARGAPGDAGRSFLLIWFWTVFGFFTLVARGDPPGRLDPVSWIWVETTMLAAVVVAGARLAGARGMWRVVAWTAAIGLLLHASVGPAGNVLGIAGGGLRSVFDMLNHAWQVLAVETVAIVQSRPLRGVAVAMAVGLVIGWFLAGGYRRTSRGRESGGPGGWY